MLNFINLSIKLKLAIIIVVKKLLNKYFNYFIIC